MNIEYLLFNLIVFCGPFALSFDRKVNFVSTWRFVFPAILVVSIPYITWDILVTGRHWWFNPLYTLDFYILNLPPGEWLFFITVPYACLFTWEVIGKYYPGTITPDRFPLQHLGVLALLAGIIFFLLGKEYTGLALMALGLTGLADEILQTGVFRQSRLYWMLGLVVLMTLIFNGYLTARPVVLYDPQYMLNLRIITIPIEDFAYGFSLVLFNILSMEWLRQWSRCKAPKAESVTSFQES